MKLNVPTLSNVNSSDELKRFTSIFASDVAQIINSNITFSDNFAAKILTFVFTVGNKTVGMEHGLGSVPSGYILVQSTVAMSVFDGNRSNTVTSIYLQATVAGTAKVLVFV